MKRWLVVLILAVGAIAVACSSSSDGNDAPRPVAEGEAQSAAAESVAVEPEPAAEPAPEPEPEPDAEPEPGGDAKTADDAKVVSDPEPAEGCGASKVFLAESFLAYGDLIEADDAAFAVLDRVLPQPALLTNEEVHAETFGALAAVVAAADALDVVNAQVTDAGGRVAEVRAANAAIAENHRSGAEIVATSLNSGDFGSINGGLDRMLEGAAGLAAIEEANAALFVSSLGCAGEAGS